MAESTQLTVVAIGGHSLLDPDLPPTVANQFEITKAAMSPLADLLDRGERVVLTHGNGPQVGFMQLRSELASAELPEVPLDSLVADSQGAMGYMIERSLRGVLRRRANHGRVVTIVTEVEVDPKDPAFENPNKPIGRFYTPEEAEALAAERGWRTMADPKRGVRRVVPSPQPQRIVQLETIRQLNDLGITVICCGGGGIPVSHDADENIVGLEAVIDKDRVSMLLAVGLEAKCLVITTSVDRVYTGFYSEDPVAHDEMTVSQARSFAEAGEFAAGSMGPKIEAAIDFLEAIDGEAIICLPEDLVAAMNGDAGTHIRRG
ncbi:MAG: carbamate kinase [Actinomycetia bacterium]|nr:carbamate kinase [Actinomycetes bacterium]MCP4962013.1 carbamate kinase [Actinomycetes bacterium]